MDEATASVDFATDEAIQAAIRSEFQSSTLVTIAHRLSSVIDYDRLLVLADGTVAEFDTPMVSNDKIENPLRGRQGRCRTVTGAERRRSGKGSRALNKQCFPCDHRKLAFQAVGAF
jgi:ABC-type protease/lipase transport system fused ATPase/permease subunit